MNNYLLAIDGSTMKTGWAIFDKDKKVLLKYGVIKCEYEDAESKQKSADNRRERILHMVDGLKEVIKEWQPNEMIMEDVPPSFGRTGGNSVTVLALGTLQGAILVLCHEYGVNPNYIPVPTWHSALGIKKANGDLKQQSVMIANQKFNLSLIYKSKTSKYNQDDIADAINIGGYYLGLFRVIHKLKTSSVYKRERR